VSKRADRGILGRAQYAAIATFRYELRRFLAFSEAAAAAEGLPAQQHQALLAVAGHQGPEPPTVGTIADQLLVAPHTAAELVARMEKANLLTKTPSLHDRRRVELTLTPQAQAVLGRLTAAHVEELTILEPALERALGRLGRQMPE
jgi:DNA-binding MarR family transcriptional regulator